MCILTTFAQEEFVMSNQIQDHEINTSSNQIGWFQEKSRSRVFVEVLGMLLFIFYLHLLLTWGLLWLFPYNPVPTSYFWGFPLSLFLARSAVPEWWEYKTKGTILRYSLFMTSILVIVSANWCFWDIGCELAKAFHFGRDAIGQAIGAGNAAGFEAVFMLTAFLLLCLWAAAAAWFCERV